MQFKNWIISEIEKEILALTCLDTISFETALRNVCGRSEAVRSYVGQNLRVNNNFKVRSLHDIMKDSQSSEEYEIVGNAKALTFRRFEQGFPRSGTYAEKMAYLARRLAYEVYSNGKKCAKIDGKLVAIESDSFYSWLRLTSCKYFGWYRPDEFESIRTNVLTVKAATFEHGTSTAIDAMPA